MAARWLTAVSRHAQADDGASSNAAETFTRLSTKDSISATGDALGDGPAFTAVLPPATLRSSPHTLGRAVPSTFTAERKKRSTVRSFHAEGVFPFRDAVL